MEENRMVAALDIGTTKIVALVAEMDKHEGVFVIGHGEAPADGLRRGVVVNMDKTVKSIRKAIEDAQLTSGTEIDRVTVGIAGEHIRSVNSHGVVAVSRSDQEIMAADVERAIDAARAMAIPVDREIIHVIPQSFSVDDQQGVRDPIGMSGVRLEVQAHIVTAAITTARNVYRALERSDLGIDHLVLESMALSDCLLHEDEMESGVAVVDIGGEITNVSVFQEGAIQHTAVVGLGSRNVTNDLAIGLRISVDQAESIKIHYGAALSSLVDPDDLVEVPAAGDRPPRELSRHVLASIIEPRVEEILTMVLREIRKAGVMDMLTSGVVLAGGGALLPGVSALAEQIFDVPVRLGELRGIEATAEELKSRRYATAHGLIKYGFKNEPQAATRRVGVKGLLQRFEDWLQKQF